MNRKGFTLIELLGVIAILGVILSITIPRFLAFIEDTKKAALKSSAISILTGLNTKTLEDQTLNLLSLNKGNIDEILGIDNTNYKSIFITPLAHNYITAIGTNKWDGYTAYGTLDTMTIVNTEDYYNNVFKYNKTYGGTGEDKSRDMIATSDGGYIIVGYTTSNDNDFNDGNNGQTDGYILKLSANGATEWFKTYGGTDYDKFYSVVETSDGGFIISGYTCSNNGDVTDGNNGFMDIWVVKINSKGTILWNKTYGGTQSEYGDKIFKTSDGGYVICTWTSSSNGDITDGMNGSNDYLIMKINATGTILWNKTYGGTNYEELDTAIPTSDGGFLLGGYTRSNDLDITDGNYGQDEYWIVKVSSTGTKEWDKTYGSVGYEELCSITQTKDGGYILSGWTDSGSTGDISEANNGYLDAWIVKISSTGVKQWDKTYGGDANDFIEDIYETDTGYVMIGTTNSLNDDITDGNYGLTDIWIVNTDINGTINWNKTIGGTLSESYTEAVKMDYDNYAIAGSTASNNYDITDGNNGGTYDSWFFKINSNGDY